MVPTSKGRGKKERTAEDRKDAIGKKRGRTSGRGHLAPRS